MCPNLKLRSGPKFPRPQVNGPSRSGPSTRGLSSRDRPATCRNHGSGLSRVNGEDAPGGDYHLANDSCLGDTRMRTWWCPSPGLRVTFACRWAPSFGVGSAGADSCRFVGTHRESGSRRVVCTTCWCVVGGATGAASGEGVAPKRSTPAVSRVTYAAHRGPTRVGGCARPTWGRSVRAHRPDMVGSFQPAPAIRSPRQPDRRAVSGSVSGFARSAAGVPGHLSGSACRGTRPWQSCRWAASASSDSRTGARC